MTEKEEMWVKEYVRKNTVLTEKGYKCPYPAVYAYPAAGQVTMQFGRGGFNIPERMLALLAEFNAEVTRREAAKEAAMN